MIPQRGVYDPRRGLQISYPQALANPQASAEVPIVFRESVRSDPAPSRQVDSSLPDWQRDLSTRTPSAIARSDKRLLAYLEGLSAFEDGGRIRDKSSRLPSTRIASRDVSQTSTYPQPEMYSPIRADHSNKRASKQVQGAIQNSAYISSRIPKRKESAAGMQVGSKQTQDFPVSPDLTSPERKENQFLPRSTYVPPQASRQRSPETHTHRPTHVSQMALAPHIMEPSRVENSISRIAHVEVSDTSLASAQDERIEEHNTSARAKADRGPFGDKFELRFSKPHDGANSDNQLRLGEGVISSRSLNMQAQQPGIPGSRRDNYSLYSQQLPIMVESTKNIIGHKDYGKPLRTTTESTFEPTLADEKHSEAEENNKPRFAFWRKPWALIASAVILLMLIAGAVVGIFFIMKDRQNSLKSGIDAPGSFRRQPSALVNNAFAAVGTSMAALSFFDASNPTGTSDINFFQHSNGDLRMALFNNSQWQPSQFVTADAHQGTPLSAFSRDNSSEINLFYFDKNKVLQEIRGSRTGSTWMNGTIGTIMQTSNAPSDLTAQDAGTCEGAGLAWLVFHTGVQNQARLLYWNENTDTWTTSGAFSNVKQGLGFIGNIDAGIWRFYYADSQSNQIGQQVCPDCCTNPDTAGWVNGLNGIKLSSVTGGIAATSVDASRMIYYQDLDGTIRELNNTNQYPNEVWMTNVSSTLEAGNNGVVAAPTSSGPAGMPVAKAMPNSRMSVVTGIQNNTQQIWLFYQAIGTEITMQARNADFAGQWSRSNTIPVGR